MGNVSPLVAVGPVAKKTRPTYVTLDAPIQPHTSIAGEAVAAVASEPPPAPPPNASAAAQLTTGLHRTLGDANADNKVAGNTATATPWKVALATRKLRSTDSYHSYCVSCWTCSEILHTEILFYIPCPDDDEQCKVFVSEDEAKGSKFIFRKEVPANLQHGYPYHVVAVACRDTGDTMSGVRCTIDQPYEATSGWTFMALDITDAQRDKLWDFCMSQLERPYSSECCCCANLLCCMCCTQYWRCSPCGVYPNLYANRGGAGPKRSWFCSEFVGTGLLAAGLNLGDDYMPSSTSPGGLYERICNTVPRHGLSREDVLPPFDHVMEAEQRKQLGHPTELAPYQPPAPPKGRARKDPLSVSASR